MKKFALILAVFIAQVSHLHAQEPLVRLSGVYSMKNALVKVDSLRTSIYGLIIDPGKIESIEVIKGSSAALVYGEEGKDGVILIKTKKKTNLLRVPALLELHRFPDSLMHYRICIDRKIINRPELILVDETQVTGIHTFVSVDWSNLNDPTEEVFLNITTRKESL